MAAAAFANSPKNFHDSIRAMFGGAGASAVSTTSLGAKMEQSANGIVDLVREQRKSNNEVIDLLKAQLKILKRGNFGSGGGGSIVGDILMAKYLPKFFGKFFGGLGSALGITTLLSKARGLKQVISSSLTRLAAQSVGTVAKVVTSAVTTSFATVAAAGRNIMKPLEGLKNIFSASGAFKSILSWVPKLAVVPKLLGKLFLPITALFGIADGFSGWKNAESLLGKDKVTLADRFTSSVGSIVNGLFLGIPDWLVQKFGGRNLSSVFATSKDKIVDGVVTLKDGVSTLMSNGFSWLNNKLPSAEVLFKAVSTDLPNLVYGIFENIRTALWDGLKFLGSAMRDTIVDTFTDIKGDFKGWMEKGAPANPKAAAAIAAGTDVGGMFKPGGAASTTAPTVMPSQQNSEQPKSRSFWQATKDFIFGGDSTTPEGATGGGAGNTVLSGSNANENAKSWYKFLTTSTDQGGLGRTPSQAKGEIASMMGESGTKLNPASYNPNDLGMPSGGTVQWRGSRLDGLYKFAEEQGKPWTDIGVQQQYYRKEMLDPSKEGRANKRILSASTSEEALDAHVRHFERPKYPDSEVNKRSRHLAGLESVNRPAPAGSTTPGSLPASMGQVTWAPGGSRKLAPRADLMSNIREVVTQALGEEYSVHSYSGGQPDKKTAGLAGLTRTGSRRHDNGMASDVMIKGPDGKVISDEQAAKVAQLYLAKQKGSVGLRMQGGGIHFDAHTKDKLRKGEALTWNYDSSNPYPQHLRSQVARGIDGERPSNLRYTDEQIQQMMNKSTTPERNRPTITSAGMGMATSRLKYDSPFMSPDAFNKKASAVPSFDSLLDSSTVTKPTPAPTGPEVSQSPGLNPNPSNAAPGPTQSPGFKVSDIPTTDEWKMLLANGSALT